MNKISEYPVISFVSLREWEQWLKTNAAKAPGIQLRFFKKASGKPSLTYEEAVEGALCYGWIDGQKNKYDEESYILRFTPRRPGSGWSKINVDRVERLTKARKMRRQGLAEVAAAKKDGRWERAYDSQKSMRMPADFEKALKAHPQAREFYETLNKANKYAIHYRITTAKKAETRERWIERCVAMLEKGEKFHP